ncbi:type II toxin-antitoxin system VapC family toxin [Xanthobacter sp. DSM 24535]|uniref:Ribonuclease VapC n=1 Tax=Aquabacter spiritensis TaxID=933073 RepID=A0A4R3LU20_9HYPH|nr:type II toxin-antitoxin system VapC family toxin [Aquabacter spiritensis]OYX66440.1 MAG: VapC toxin family PIN domain ribonuclease [Rhizobiales bacterium 32-66-11]TCT01877.1 ribonuclease VapC [Aquabacter spiritensis]
MFVDSSVLVAILADEPDAAGFATKLAAAPHRYTSGPAVLEAAIRLSRRLAVDPVAAETRLSQVLEEARISLIPINGSITKRAVAAVAAFGMDGNHPAQLSLADCLSYASARAYRVPLLFKGAHFSQTDIEVA